jgi:hypothetical protein
MLFAFLVFGAWPFWVFLAAFAIIEIACVEFEKAGIATWVAILAAGLLIAFGPQEWGPWLLHHPLTILKWIGYYIASGVVWSLIKWFFFVWKARDELKSEKEEFLKNAGPKGTPLLMFADAVQQDQFYRDFGSSHRRYKIDADHPYPTAARHKGRILFWMSYWPFSAIWTLLHEPVTRLYRFLYRRLSGLFDGIAVKMFGKLREEF